MCSNKQINNFMGRAIELSIENVKNGTGGPFGCVIVKNGQIIAEGSNKVTVKNDPTAHAEIEAIRIASKTLNGFDLSECDLYTSCYPCPMCYGAIRWARIKNIYYANTKDDAHNIGFSDRDIYDAILNSCDDLIKIDHPKAIDAFKLWSESSNKIEY